MDVWKHIMSHHRIYRSHTLFNICKISSTSMLFINNLTFISPQMYTFMWISVDRYLGNLFCYYIFTNLWQPHLLAVRKPLRYETVQTKTRCQCWMCFTWISAAMLCCPTLWTEKDPTFDKYAYICVPNWPHMAAYSVTLGILVLGPSLISIFYNYGYIFSMMRKLRSGVAIHDKEWVLKFL